MSTRRTKNLRRRRSQGPPPHHRIVSHAPYVHAPPFSAYPHPEYIILYTTCTPERVLDLSTARRRKSRDNRIAVFGTDDRSHVAPFTNAPCHSSRLQFSKYQSPPGLTARGNVRRVWRSSSRRETFSKPNHPREKASASL